MRVNIHLPDDLYERVKALGDLNVSAVCQGALEREVRLCAAANLAGGDLVEVVARLGRTRQEEHDVAREGGYRVGQAWARGRASWAELAQLAERPRVPAMSLQLDVGHSLRHTLLDWAVERGGDPDEDWYQVLTETPFNRGLVDAAVEVFEAVRDLVPAPDGLADPSSRIVPRREGFEPEQQVGP